MNEVSQRKPHFQFFFSPIFSIMNVMNEDTATQSQINKTTNQISKLCQIQYILVIRIQIKIPTVMHR